MVSLQALIPDPSGRSVTIDLAQGGTVVETQAVTLGAGGAYSFTTNQVGTFDVFAKSSHWLRQLQAGVVITTGGTSTVDFSLLNGDIVEDNEVNLTDYSALANAFGSIDGDPNWNPNADLNGDQEVSLADYSILGQNFGQIGDE